jgi:hypothetical protein
MEQGWKRGVLPRSWLHSCMQFALGTEIESDVGFLLPLCEFDCSWTQVWIYDTTTKNPALLCTSDVVQGMAVKLSKLDPYLKLISEPYEILWLSQFLVPLQE